MGIRSNVKSGTFISSPLGGIIARESMTDQVRAKVFLKY